MTCQEAAADLHRLSQMIEDGVENLIVLAMQSLNITDAIEDGASQASSAPSRYA